MFDATAWWFQSALQSTWRDAQALASAVRLPERPALPPDFATVWATHATVIAVAAVGIVVAAAVLTWAVGDD